MRLFVTGHSSRGGGGLSVARNLIASFGRVAPRHSYCITIPPGLGFEESSRTIPDCETHCYLTKDLPSRWWWEQTELPRLLRRFRADVVFNLGNRGLNSDLVPQATLVQDAHLFYPSSRYGSISAVRRLKFWYHRYWFKRVLPKTRLLFCQTDVARQRLLATYGSRTRIVLCPNAFSIHARPTSRDLLEPESLRPFRGKFRLFALTRYYEHKNLEIVPIMFAREREKLGDVVVVLTISACEHPRARRLLRMIDRLGLRENIITVGELRQEELAAYYAHTDALFLPTLLESFSGTYIEAMMFGRPILTSDMDFARAVCGEAAVYFNPCDPSDIAVAIAGLRDDSAVRRGVTDAGQQRLQQHFLSWDEIGREVIRELESLA